MTQPPFGALARPATTPSPSPRADGEGRADGRMARGAPLGPRESNRHGSPAEKLAEEFVSARVKATE